MRLPAATRLSTTRPSTLPPIRSLVLLLAVLLGLLGLLGTVVPPSRAVAGTEPVGEWPLRPRPAVVAGFDPPADPWGAGHRGVDLLGHAGQPVRAALPGTVTYAGGLAGRGVVVVSPAASPSRSDSEDANCAATSSPGRGGQRGDCANKRAQPFRQRPSFCARWRRVSVGLRWSVTIVGKLPVSKKLEFDYTTFVAQCQVCPLPQGGFGKARHRKDAGSIQLRLFLVLGRQCILCRKGTRQVEG